MNTKSKHCNAISILLLMGTVCFACSVLDPTNMCVAEGFFGAGVDENGNSYDIIATEDCMTVTPRPAAVDEDGSVLLTPNRTTCCAEAKKIIYDPDGAIVAQIDTTACNTCDAWLYSNPLTPCTGKPPVLALREMTLQVEVPNQSA